MVGARNGSQEAANGGTQFLDANGASSISFSLGGSLSSPLKLTQGLGCYH
jgi:hypothetical protein